MHSDVTAFGYTSVDSRTLTTPELKRGAFVDRSRISLVVLPLLLLGAAALNAQSKVDQDLLKQARSLYFSPASRPAYIACDSALDWDAVAKDVSLPQTEGYLRGLELVKAMRIAFVTRNASSTEVMVTGDTTLAQQKKMMQQQIAAFFSSYWEMSDGRLFPGAHIPYEVATTPEGYLVTLHLENGIVGTLQMDSSFLITKVHAIGKTSDVELTPKFARENDGLLHLRGVLVDRKVGQSRLLVEYSFDYQEAGGFYVPRHVTMSMPGALSYTHTFSNCQVLNKSNAPPASIPATDEP
jgi:hypothetical protein